MERIDVLLIEDDPRDADLMKRVLAKQSPVSNVYTVEDGEEALNFIFCRGKFSERNIEDNPNLILLDLKLPKVDGFEILKRIRENTYTKSVKVVVFSSSGLEDDVERAQQLGADLYIQKPMSFKEFENAVATIGDYGWLQDKCLNT